MAITLNLLPKDSMDKETKELRAIARFYKDTKRGDKNVFVPMTDVVYYGCA